MKIPNSILVLSICFIFFSNILSAQTTGPNQPEVTSFPSVSGDGMVDLYTGNLNYNIPLLVVPGPDGGYPITLGYTASPSVNNVPTWVGYNWNINTGAIVRNKRGIPDDFNGSDLLKKTTHIKDKWNIGIPIAKGNMPVDIFGADISLAGKASMYYDNYAGFGVKAGGSLTTLHKSEDPTATEKEKGAFSIGLNFDSKTGLQMSPELSIDKILKKKDKKNNSGKLNLKNLGFGNYGTFRHPYFGKYMNKRVRINSTTEAITHRYSLNYGLSFSSHSPISSISIPRSTTSIDLDIATDISLPILKTKLKIKGNYSISKITEPYQEIPMYGSMFSSVGQANNDGIMDSYRDNDSPITKNSPNMPVAVNSFDVFSINAAGIGGSFRLYRNDVGQFMPKYIKNTATNTEIGADFGAGAGAFDIGTDLNFAHSKSYSGKWNNPKRINSLDSYLYSNKTPSKPLYEPAYFKLIGESYPLPLEEYKNMEYDRPIAFDIGNWKNTIDKPLSFKAKAFSTYNSGRNNLDVNNKSHRNPRTTSIEYKTRDEIVSGIGRGEGLYKNKHIIKKQSGGVKSLHTVSYSNGRGHHINQISVRKSNGSVYNFALPAYNTDETKVVFATKEEDIDGDKKISFTATEASPNNTSGDDNYFSKEVTPAYAHSYFLTSIQSLDYIDVKNDGFTDDDLGTWTKFIYTEVDNYHWRFPFDDKKASFIDGYNGNKEDNKGTYTEGDKDLYYVTEIETKTHIAVFDINDSALTDTGGSNSQKYLKKLSLYSKSDPNYKPEFYLNPAHDLNPIKEVHFNYDYSLKSNTSSRSPIPNFSRTTSSSSDNILTNNIGGSGQNGTLTLKELYFTYKKNYTGKDSRYKFDYNNKYAFPKKYSEDRWGSYQPEILLGNNVKYNSYENPYTFQKDSKMDRDEKAGLWCLNKITLPSNGSIEIDYEKDDYSYVQNKKAMEYVRILGVGYSSTGQFKDFKDYNGYAELKNSSGQYADRLYLDVTSKKELEERINDLKYIGFKAFMFLNHKKKLTNLSGKDYKDYVSGYLEKKEFFVDSTSHGVYLQIKPIKPTNTATYKFHPFQIATIQYIRNYRPDIQTTFAIESDPIKFVKKNLKGLIKSIKPLFKDYIKEKAKDGWGKNFLATKPSFLRLNTIDRKYGGDNRVKQVKLFPDPTNTDVYYGKEYQYTLNDEDGTSSGVAEMEPITGHEENGIVQPKFYRELTGNKLLWLIQSESESAFVETPFGTSFLPAASVGYSRVIERSLSPKDASENVDKTQNGITITEFFTAKDFPTKSKLTSNPFRPIIKPIKVTIPFIGDLSINNAGFTQGAAFTINNAIYGKQKRISVYPYSNEEPNGHPVSEVEYVYKTNTNNTLNNKVKFLKKEGDVVEAYLGKEYDFYLEQYENGTRTIGGGVRPDIKFTPLAIPWPSLWPTINYMESTSSYISTTKVIYNSPILEKTIQYKDGSKVISSPEYYDYETGNPIINSVTNEFNNKIYSYSFPAHWSYPRMKGAYKNYGAKLLLFNSTPGRFKLAPSLIANTILFEGDELILYSNQQGNMTTRVYVSDINLVDNDFKLSDRQNNAPAITGYVNSLSALNTLGNNAEAIIDRSGHRNLQSVSKGSIVSLGDDLATNDFTDPIAPSIQVLQYFMMNYNYAQPRFTTTIFQSYVDSGIFGSVNLGQCSIIDLDVGFNYNNSMEDIMISFPNQFDPNQSECFITSNSKSTDGIQYHSLDISKFVFDTNSFTGSQVNMKYINPDPTSNTFAANGKTFLFNLNGTGNCFVCQNFEERTPIPILQANAVEFSEDFISNFNTLPNEETDISGQILTNIYQNNSANPYAFGVKGIPRSKRTWAYIESRKQEGNLGNELRNDIDGQFDYYPFKWHENYKYNENYNWRWVNEITQYNANGSSEEGKNRLEMFSANLFGYKNLLVTAAAQNAKHSDIVYDGFEDYDGNKPIYIGTNPTYRTLDNGNVDFGVDSKKLWPFAHTGNWSLLIDNDLTINTNNVKFFKPENKKYIISAWVYFDDLTIFNQTVKLKGGTIEIFENGSLLTTIAPDRSKNNVIDNWLKIEGEFEPSSANSTIKIKLIPPLLSNGNKGSLFDDIRIQPLNSTMQTYVYDPEDYSLRYILNNQNYFSEFIRDSEGSLIQKNIETEEGKKTLSINRSNISKN